MRTTFAVLIALLTLTVNGFAQVSPAPSLLNFQGRLARPDGTPVPDGNYSLRFSLWSAASAGTERWNQTVNPVAVRNGTFAALLNVASPATLFDNDLWMEIKIGADAPLTPRQRLVSVAYAQKANTVPDNAITSAKILDGAITGADIANGAITANKLASGALNSLSWLLNGNSGTNPASQFLGTTDNQPLVFRANNQRALRLEYVQNGSVVGLNTLGGFWGNVLSSGVVGGTVLGGLRENATDMPNRVTDQGGTVSGGVNNLAGNNNSDSQDAVNVTIAGGSNNNATGGFSAIGGGNANTASGFVSVVTGGDFNTASGHRSVVSGGNGNTAAGVVSGVASGYINNASGFAGIVAGGQNNQATTDFTAVGGGANNLASGAFSVVGGGQGNIASGFVSAIAGGDFNTASGTRSTVLGGNSNTAAGEFSAAAGFRAKANHAGTFVWADSQNQDFASTGPDQFLIRAKNGVSINTTPSVSYGLWVTGGLSAGIYGVGPTVGVQGDSQNGYGLQGTSYYGAGVYGQGTDGFGVRGNSTNNNGVYGTSQNSAGVEGYSNNNIGVRGSSNNSYGVIGISSFNVGVYGQSTNNQNASIYGYGGVNNVAVFAGNLAAFGRAAFESNLSTGAGTSHIFCANNGSGVFSVSGSGQVFAAGGYTTSDSRYKTHVTSLENSLNLILNLRGVAFEWDREAWKSREFPEGRQIGFIAQEVEKVLPALVHTDTNGYKSVAYANIVPVLVEAVKIQNRQMETLNAENASLKQRNADIEAALKEVLARLQKLENAGR